MKEVEKVHIKEFIEKVILVYEQMYDLVKRDPGINVDEFADPGSVSQMLNVFTKKPTGPIFTSIISMLKLLVTTMNFVLYLQTRIESLQTEKSILASSLMGVKDENKAIKDLYETVLSKWKLVEPDLKVSLNGTKIDIE
jgi:hypothetical protein